MSKQTINIGASPNDGTGTPLRTSFDYTNQNFTELYTALGGGVGLPGATTQVIFNDGGTNLAGDAGLVYNKTTDALTVAGLVTAGSATITGAATVGTTLGVTGVSTLASAVVTGALTVDTTTLVVDPTNDRVGIGTATPAVPLQVKKDGVASGAGWTAIGRFHNVAETKGVDLGYNPSNNNAIITALSGGTASGFEFWSLDGSWANRATLNSAGLYVTNGNVVMSTSGTGIDFSATANGSGTMTSELLADYEEGTTSTITIATQTSGTITLNGSFNTLSYTKIGRLVTVTGNLLVSSVSLPIGGYIDVGGLPFARNGSRNTDTSPSISVISAVSAGATTFYGYIPTSSTSTLRIIGDATQYQANTEIIISLQYFV